MTEILVSIEVSVEATISALLTNMLFESLRHDFHFQLFCLDESSQLKCSNKGKGPKGTFGRYELASSELLLSTSFELERSIYRMSISSVN